MIGEALAADSSPWLALPAGAADVPVSPAVEVLPITEPATPTSPWPQAGVQPPQGPVLMPQEPSWSQDESSFTEEDSDWDQDESEFVQDREDDSWSQEGEDTSWSQDEDETAWSQDEPAFAEEEPDQSPVSPPRDPNWAPPPTTEVPQLLPAVLAQQAGWQGEDAEAPAEPALYSPPQIDPDAVPAHSPLVPTVRFRGRQTTQVSVAALRGSPESTADSMAPSPAEGKPSRRSQGDQTASGTTTAPRRTDEAPPTIQKHQTAATALGIDQSRHPLTRQEQAGVVVLVMFALAAAVLAVLALTGDLPWERGPSSRSTTQQSAPPANPDQPAPGAQGATDWSLGQTFKTGSAVLQITSYEAGLPGLGEAGTELSERGQWVLVGVTVKNGGDKDVTFPTGMQVLVTQSGKEYQNEPESALKYADFVLGANAIKPAGQQSGYLAFDIPSDDPPTSLRLVGQLSDPPVTVPLG
ncbi:MAG: DUF4352 domain-containing protein [Bifidobacteriaceae bacterium]|jgi:hypothetical protein|nr:DUF4352 domain-containing protein [Bifidobacteriaceae bacterium]